MPLADALECPITAKPVLSFQSLATNPSLGLIIRHAFKQRIQPIYGDQTAALKRVFAQSDRSCELLLDGDRPVGLLLYKDVPNDEWSTLGVVHSLEIKTLIVLSAERNRGKGYGRALLTRSAEVAMERGAQSLFVTASSTRPQVLGFFRHFAFDEFQRIDCPNRLATEHYFAINSRKLCDHLACSGAAINEHPKITPGLTQIPLQSGKAAARARRGNFLIDSQLSLLFPTIAGSSTSNTALAHSPHSQRF